MLKKLLKAVARSTVAAMGISAILLVFLSLLPPAATLPDHARLFLLEFWFKDMLMILIVVPIGATLEFFILEYKLFSDSLWVRRIIVIIISCIIIAIGILLLFFNSAITRQWTVTAVVLTVILGAGSAVLAYRIYDKKRKKEADAINQRLNSFCNE